MIAAVFPVPATTLIPVIPAASIYHGVVAVIRAVVAVSNRIFPVAAIPLAEPPATPCGLQCLKKLVVL